MKMNNKQVQTMCKDFLMLHPPSTVYSSMSARQAMNSRWGIDIDHHEFAYAIDDLIRKGKMDRVYTTCNWSIYPQFRILEVDDE